jgi:hypothetical protein
MAQEFESHPSLTAKTPLHSAGEYRIRFDHHLSIAAVVLLIETSQSAGSINFLDGSFHFQF